MVTFAPMQFYPRITSFLLDGLVLLPATIYLIWLGFVGYAGDENLKMMVGAGFGVHLMLKYLGLFTPNPGVRVLQGVISVIMLILLLLAFLLNLASGEWFENFAMFLIMAGIIVNLQVATAASPKAP